ncbi:MAG: sel1 repeat family protein [Thermoguttaceae bacterium]|nr:sel1 repeat family protein [Thermoguttaceae bacterium]
MMKNERFQIWYLGIMLFCSLPMFCLANETEFVPEDPTFLEAMELYEGSRSEEDVLQAIQLFERAAVEEKHIDSMKMLIRIYSLGEYVEVDEQKILKYIQMAAEAGDADCQFALGEVLVGDKDPEKKKESLPWFERAAEQDHPAAQRILGVFCSTGKYLPKDDEKAVFWFQKAADQGDTLAQMMLGMSLRDGIGTEKDEKKAFSYLLKAAKAGNATAQYNVAVCYINGTGTKRDTKKAEHYIRLSAQQGFPPAVQAAKRFGIRLSNPNFLREK